MPLGRLAYRLVEAARTPPPSGSLDVHAASAVQERCLVSKGGCRVATFWIAIFPASYLTFYKYLCLKSIGVHGGT